MWYIIPSFVPTDPSMYSMYYSRIKGPNPLIFGWNKRYVIGVTQPEQGQPIERLV